MSREENNQLIPTPIIGFYEAWLNRHYHEELDYEVILSSLTKFALTHFHSNEMPYNNTPATNLLEILIQEIVSLVVLQLKADYSMSSSIRDIQPLLEQDYAHFLENLHSLTSKHFFTCLVSRPNLSIEIGEQLRLSNWS